MVEILQVTLLIVAALFSFGLIRLEVQLHSVAWISRIVAKRRTKITAVGGIVLVGCLTLVGELHEAIPRIHDEFSYLLMAETFSSGHMVNPSPPLTQFFDTFHELMQPVYVSKYFPAQGVFLAAGKILTGHPIAGVWLSSALACCATYWMLEAWITSTWAFFGAILMALQLGIYSYWSQSYWGGMVAALGGALFWGAARRLWDRMDWRNAIWLALGLVILASSRPLEGFIATLPLSILFLVYVGRKHRWNEQGFWPSLFLVGLILSVGAGAAGAYNRAITGSAWKTPYMVHESQYQESPPFIFISPRPAVKYSSFWLWEYYHLQETQQYEAQRSPALWLVAVARKFRSWWFFYCGILLTPALVLPGLLRGGGVQYIQAALLVMLTILGVTMGSPPSVPVYALVDALVLVQAWVLWTVFDDFWSRVALSTIFLLLLQALFDKWFFPHYFAPTTCLIFFLQVAGLRKVWHHAQSNNHSLEGASRSERRRLQRKATKRSPQPFSWRTFVLLVPVMCFLSLVVRVEARINDWSEDFHEPEWGALPLHDWSVRRAELDRWLEKQPGPQLVFVRYPLRHNVYFEWVFNHADLVHSHVIWARDLGSKNDELLLNQFPDRTAWLVDGDAPQPQLIPYSEVGFSSGFSPQGPANNPGERQPAW
jgi:hypothetical protein